MERVLRITAAAAFGLALVGIAPAAHADAHEGVTVGGWIEFIGGTSDHDEGVDGISRGLFSRISVGYDTTLDNGLQVSGRAAYQLNQRGGGDEIVVSPRESSTTRMDSATNYAPDVLFISVGGGFGKISVGAHAPSNCAMMPRPIAFVSGGVNSTHYTLFTGLSITNGTFSEWNYCGTPNSVSYATPNIGGFEAMFTYAPDSEANQGTTISNAQDNDGNIKDLMNLAAKWTGSMGAMNASLGVGYQSGSGSLPERELDSLTFAGTVGFGGFTFGAAWFDTDEGKRTPSEVPVAGIDRKIIQGDAMNDFNPASASWDREQDGWTIAGKYEMGAMTFAATYSSMERDAFGASTEIAGDPVDAVAADTQILVTDARTVEETALVLGASYAVGGGLTTWIEYMDLERDNGATMARLVETDTGLTDGEIITDGAALMPTPVMAEKDDDSLVLIGVTLGF